MKTLLSLPACYYNTLEERQQTARIEEFLDCKVIVAHVYKDKNEPSIFDTICDVDAIALMPFSDHNITESMAWVLKVAKQLHKNIYIVTEGAIVLTTKVEIQYANTNASNVVLPRP